MVMLKFTRPILVATAVIIGAVPHSSFAQSTYLDSESLRADVLTVLELQTSIQRKIEPVSAKSEQAIALISYDISTASPVTWQELEALQRYDFSLQPYVEELQALESSLDSISPAGPQKQSVVSSNATFGCDGFIEPIGELVDPPGPCEQTYYAPTSSPPGYNLSPYPLTDLEYPDLLGCRAYRSPQTVLGWRTATAVAQVVQMVADRACKQEFTVAGVGGNASLLCIITDLAYLAVKTNSDNIANCQTFRIDTEGTATYVRAGELFVQSSYNTSLIKLRADDGFEQGQSGMDDISEQVEENSRSIEEVIKILSELSETMDIDNSRLLSPDAESQ